MLLLRGAKRYENYWNEREEEKNDNNNDQKPQTDVIRVSRKLNIVSLGVLLAKQPPILDKFPC